MSTPRSRVFRNGQDITQDPELASFLKFRLNVQRLALLSASKYQYVLNRITHMFIQRDGELDQYLDSFENSAQDVPRVLTEEYPDLIVAPRAPGVPWDRSWCFHGRSQTSTDESVRADKIGIDGELVAVVVDILDGYITLEETTKYLVLFLYIATELHEVQHYLVLRLLPFVKKKPKLVGGMCSSKTGEAGFHFERHMLGYVPTAVWEISKFGDPKQIVRLEGVIQRRENGFDNEYGWSLGEGILFTLLKSLVDRVVEGNFSEWVPAFPILGKAGLPPGGASDAMPLPERPKLGINEIRARCLSECWLENPTIPDSESASPDPGQVPLDFRLIERKEQVKGISFRDEESGLCRWSPSMSNCIPDGDEGS